MIVIFYDMFLLTYYLGWTVEKLWVIIGGYIVEAGNIRTFHNYTPYTPLL